MFYLCSHLLVGCYMNMITFYFGTLYSKPYVVDMYTSIIEGEAYVMAWTEIHC